MVDMCGGQPPGVRLSPVPRQAPSAPEERSAMSSEEPVCCDLEPGLSAWFPLHPIFPARWGAPPRPCAGHAARHTQRAVCWGGKHVPRRLKVSCFTCSDPGPGNNWNSGAPHTSLWADTAMPGPTGSRDLHP